MDIKIRAWNNEMKRFFYVDNSFSITLHDTGSSVTMWCSDGIVDEITADAVIQSTGIKDKEGKEIWFGDVYNIYGYGHLCIEKNSDLVELFQAACEDDIGAYIGNIYQNPELIENNNE